MCAKAVIVPVLVVVATVQMIACPTLTCGVKSIQCSMPVMHVLNKHFRTGMRSVVVLTIVLPIIQPQIR